MNKKFLAISCLCLLSGVALATSTELCGSLRVTIQNNSAYDCTLENHFLINGNLIHGTSVPSVIFKGQSGSFDMKRSEGYVANLVTYQCGDNNAISLYSIRFNTRFSGMIMDFESLNKKNMDATAILKKEKCDDWRASVNYNKIEWTIKDTSISQ